MKNSSAANDESFLFVINPVSGKKRSRRIIPLIEKEARLRRISYQILVWENKEHFENIESLIRSGQFKKIIVVGGDGTINRVASCMIHSEMTLGIIPCGSGNGLARSLGFSMNPRKALKQNLEFSSDFIDAGRANGHYFFCTAGAGFDGFISHCFAKSQDRGLKTYAHLVWKHLFRYRGIDLQIKMDQAIFENIFFMVTIANAPQFGNNFYIAPDAKMNDGLLQLTGIPSVTPSQLLLLLWKTLQKKIHREPVVLNLQHSRIQLTSSEPFPYHLDGEPQSPEKQLNIEILPRSLRIITPVKKFMEQP